MAGVLLVIYPNELDRLLRSPGGPVGRHLVKLAEETAREAERNATSRGAPRSRSGRYGRNFRVETDFTGPNGFTVRVRNATTGQHPRRKASYAATLETGSKPHRIAVRKKSNYLHFFYNGRWIRVKEVKHPGTRPYWVLKDALRTTILKHGGR